MYIRFEKDLPFGLLFGNGSNFQKLVVRLTAVWGGSDAKVWGAASLS